MKVIFEPLRSYLRYGRNGPCFIGFRGRLTLQALKNVEGCRENELSGIQNGAPCPSQGLARWMAEPLRLQGSAMADPHGRAPLLGVSEVGQAGSDGSFERVSLVLGDFLDAPNSYEGDFRTVAKLSSVRAQRSLFHRIQRSFDPPSTQKRRRMSRKRTVGDPKRGPLPIPGARPLDGRAPASAGLGHGRPPWPSSPVGGLGGRPGVVGSPF